MWLAALGAKARGSRVSSPIVDGFAHGPRAACDNPFPAAAALTSVPPYDYRFTDATTRRSTGLVDANERRVSASLQ
jgi:hypothetical protein